MARTTFPKSPKYLTSAALNVALQRSSPVPQSEYVTVRDLAKELRLKDPEQLRPLIELQYLRLLIPAEYLADCQVARPLPAAMEWLKQMLAPIHMRPLVPIDIAAELLRTTAEDVRRLCLAWNIQLVFDPAFGELLSPTNFYRLFQKVFQVQSGKARYDRQRLLWMIAVAKNRSEERTIPLPYNGWLEREIARIARLKEPERSMRAVALYDAMVDATTIEACIKQYRQSAGENIERAKVKLMKLVERSVGQ